MVQENSSYQTKPWNQERDNRVNRRARGAVGEKAKKKYSSAVSVPAPDFDPGVNSYALAA